MVTSDVSSYTEGIINITVTHPGTPQAPREGEREGGWVYKSMEGGEDYDLDEVA